MHRHRPGNVAGMVVSEIYNLSSSRSSSRLGIWWNRVTYKANRNLGHRLRRFVKDYYKLSSQLRDFNLSAARHIDYGYSFNRGA